MSYMHSNRIAEKLGQPSFYSTITDAPEERVVAVAKAAERELALDL